MLETQRNEYATEVVELGNRAEAVLQERNLEYGEELARVNQRSEAYLGHQSEEITKLRHELSMANNELQQSIQVRAHLIRNEGEMASMNEMMNNEIAIQ